VVSPAAEAEGRADGAAEAPVQEPLPAAAQAAARPEQVLSSEGEAQSSTGTMFAIISTTAPDAGGRQGGPVVIMAMEASTPTFAISKPAPETTVWPPTPEPATTRRRRRKSVRQLQEKAMRFYVL
jgi:hypothetical protein